MLITKQIIKLIRADVETGAQRNLQNPNKATTGIVAIATLQSLLHLLGTGVKSIRAAEIRVKRVSEKQSEEFFHL